MLAVGVIDERVGIVYFIVHCERAFAHLIEMAIEWCASWVLLRLSVCRVVSEPSSEKDALLGAVIDGEEDEAGWVQEEIGACVSIDRHVQLTGNAISHGLNRFHHGLDIQRLFALVCWRSTCLFQTFHTSITEYR